ncbi:MAG: type-2 restriction enzyme [Saprospiraceae bacterium]|nr:MAG: type-2 restriction enzyme [Saprospiraceae bacterium]
MDVSKFDLEIEKAIKKFWDTRKSQSKSAKGMDTGNRSSVTGGKQMDGFVFLLKTVAVECGVPDEWIYTKGSILPGYFRPTKNWDIVIISNEGILIAAAELKSQVGSFGNNFNNRTEEALGCAIDLWTAFRENSFKDQTAPWIGYLMVVEASEKSMRVVKIKSPYFHVRKEFENTSYIDRYDLLCKKLVTERHYNAASVIQTSADYRYSSLSNLTSIQTFLRNFTGHLLGSVDQKP